MFVFFFQEKDTTLVLRKHPKAIHTDTTLQDVPFSNEPLFSNVKLKLNISCKEETPKLMTHQGIK